MTEPVQLKQIHYLDRTGYATHVHFEVTQYPHPGGPLSVAAFSVPVRRGEAFLLHSGAKQVIELTAQPVISPSPSEIEPLGAPVSFRAKEGEFVEDATVVTIGNLIVRSAIPVVDVAPVGGSSAIDAPGPIVFEISFNSFDYHDQIGGANGVDVLIHGVFDGQVGIHGPYRLSVDETTHQSDPLNEGPFSDVTRVEFTPRKGSSPYESPTPVVVTPSPGYYLTHVHGVTQAPPATPANVASSQQRQPIPWLEAEATSTVIVRPEPSGPSKSAKRSTRKEKSSKR